VRVAGDVDGAPAAVTGSAAIGRYNRPPRDFRTPPLRHLRSFLVALALTPHLAAAEPAALRAPNVVEISPTLVTSGQPSPATLARLRELGFAAVINLAPPNAHDAVRDEPAIVGGQGLAYVALPVAFDNPTNRDFDEFAAALRAQAGRKVLVHCQVNMRASTMVFLYRVIVAKEDPQVAYDSVIKVWVPSGPWKRLLRDELRSHQIDFEPY